MSNMVYDRTATADIIALHKAGLLSSKEARAIISQWFPILGQLAAAEKTSES